MKKFFHCLLLTVTALTVVASSAYGDPHCFLEIKILEEKKGQNVKFTIQGVRSLYGRYSSQAPKKKSSPDTYDYTLDVVNEKGEVLTSHTIGSPRFASLDFPNGGAIVELDSEVLTIVIPNSDQIAKLKIFTDAWKKSLDLSGLDLSCIKTCSLQGEKENCCSWLKRVQDGQHVGACIECGDGICSEFEDSKSCFADCGSLISECVPGTKTRVGCLERERLAHYTFNGTITDAVSGSLEGTIIEQSSPTFGDGGPSSKTLKVGLDVGYAKVPVSLASKRNGATVTLWFNVNRTGGSALLTALKDSYKVFSVGLNGSNSIFLTDHLGNKDQSIDGVNLNNGWNQLALVEDESAGFAIFVNGNRIASNESAIDLLSDSLTDLFLGGIPLGSTVTNSASGAVDELIVFRRALTDGEIRDIYNGACIPAQKEGYLCARRSPSAPNRFLLSYDGEDIFPTLTWERESSAEYFEVHRADPVTGQFALIKRTYDLSFRDTQGFDNTTRLYKIRGVNKHGRGDFSDVVTGELRIIPGVDNTTSSLTGLQSLVDEIRLLLKQTKIVEGKRKKKRQRAIRRKLRANTRELKSVVESMSAEGMLVNLRGGADVLSNGQRLPKRVRKLLSSEPSSFSTRKKKVRKIVRRIRSGLRQGGS